MKTTLISRWMNSLFVETSGFIYLSDSSNLHIVCKMTVGLKTRTNPHVESGVLQASVKAVVLGLHLMPSCDITGMCHFSPAICQCNSDETDVRMTKFFYCKDKGRGESTFVHNCKSIWSSFHCADVQISYLDQIQECG